MNISIEQIQFALLITAIVSMIARRLNMPYTVGLIIAGIGVALSPVPLNGALLTKDLIFKAFLPPLIFEAAFLIPWGELKKDLPVTLLLATVGVVISAGVIAAGAYYLLEWPIQIALLFGALISATDPVSVIATFKSAKVTGRLAMLVESESLLNDATAVVLFIIMFGAVTLGQEITVGHAAMSFLTIAGGGLLCGLAVSAVTLFFIHNTDDYLVEITFTTIAAYGSFLLAEHFHASGVLATLVTGLMLGNIGRLGILSDKGRVSVMAFWEYIGFAVNSLIFLFMGLPLVNHNFGPTIWWPLGCIIAIILLARAVAVYGLCSLFSWSPKLKVSLPHQHILVWGGLRGALSLALVLGLPHNMPMRETITAITFGVVAFSIIAQGLTMTPLLRYLGILERKDKIKAYRAGKVV